MCPRNVDRHRRTELIRDTLVRRGEELLARPYETVRFTGNSDADALLNDLEHHPHAFVIACVMDRQTSAERAWLIPHLLKERLAGSFSFEALSELSPTEVKKLMLSPTPLHRFPDVMAENLHAAVERIRVVYGGVASRIWAGCPSSATIVRKFLGFRGVGPKIAAMAANILVRDFKIPVADKVSIDVSADIHVRRVFKRLGLIGESASNEELIYRARELNPLYPGVVDLSAWEIGRTWCRPQNPLCSECYMRTRCAFASRVSGEREYLKA